MLTHIQLLCGGARKGCPKSVSVPLFLFEDPDQLRRIVEQADFYLLEGHSRGHGGLSAYTVFCGDCAEGILPAGSKGKVEQKRLERICDG
jgi:hypothetical protein